jgi:hypothetical protein
MVAERSPRIRAPRSYKRDVRVYALIEEARLRCEALRAAAGTDERRRELRRLHRDLGLSGLYASTNIPAEARRTLLSRVHARCDHLPRGRAGSARGLQRTVRRAVRALRRGVAKDGPAEHLELAQLHLLRAMEFLIAPPSPRPAAVHVFRPRHLA